MNIGETNLGTPHDVANAIFEGIGEFAVSNPLHVMHVNIVVFDSSKLTDYKQAMQSQEAQSYNPTLSYGQRAQRARMFCTSHALGKKSLLVLVDL